MIVVGLKSFSSTLIVSIWIVISENEDQMVHQG